MSIETDKPRSSPGIIIADDGSFNGPRIEHNRISGYRIGELLLGRNAAVNVLFFIFNA